MKQLSLHTRVGPDGVLNLQIPVGFANMDLDVVLVLQPAPAVGWPADYFAQTYGAFADEPLSRADQGLFEARDPLA
jgi:hypothetical protein